MKSLRLLCCFFSFAAAAAPPPSLAIRWSFLQNVAGPPPRSISELTIINTAKKWSPVTGWKIYFNSNRSIDTTSLQGDLRITHINGDLFCLVPLKASTNYSVKYTCSDLSMNISDAPIGFYFVWDNAPDKGYPVADYQAGRIEDPNLYLLAPDLAFSRNIAATDIPVGKLPLVFPTPVSLQRRPGTLRLSRPVLLADPAFRHEAAYLSSALLRLSAPTPPAGTAKATGQTTKIILRKTLLDTSAYRLDINSGRILIEACTGEGIFYGIQSLLSVIGPPSSGSSGSRLPGSGRTLPGSGSSRTLPCLHLDDHPRFPYRGLLIDVARSFRSPRELRRILDVMARCKMNTLHLHLTDDEGWRLEIPGLPELTSVGSRRGLSTTPILPPSFGSGPRPDHNSGSGYYTRTEYISLLRYATARHIAIIPEIEGPGHARAAIRSMDARYITYVHRGEYPKAIEYLLRDTLDHSAYEGAQLWKDNVLCPALVSVYRFMDKITSEIMLMYREADAPLATIHLGGDEVPAGVWEGSPACRSLLTSEPATLQQHTDDPATPQQYTNDPATLRQYCWKYFYTRLDSLLARRALALSGWEEAATAGKDFCLYVWDNMIGGGNEDLPYRLANAGNKVVLACVSNNYYDLAYDPSFYEKGYHWGGFQGMDKPFSFIPYDYYRNSTVDYLGNPVPADYFSKKEKLSAEGRKNIFGIEGLLWGENLPTDQRTEYMLLPKLFGTAERAWAADPAWSTAPNSPAGPNPAYDSAYNLFLNIIAKKLLPWLNGYAYRIPPPAAQSQHGFLFANSPLPGYTIRFTMDGSEPTAQSRPYTQPITYHGIIKLALFNTQGRSSRTITIENKAITHEP